MQAAAGRWRLIAVLTALALVPAGCRSRVERDAEGDVKGVEVAPDTDAARELRQEGREAREGLARTGREAKDNLGQAGRELQAGAKQVGAALERGAKRIEAEVGPVARDVLDDASVTTKVKAKLIADPEVNAFHIDVDTIDGRVTLNGKVESADQRAEAEKLASRTDGVKEVVNLIQVAGQPPPAPPSR